MDQEVVLRSLTDLLDDGRFGVWSGYYIICNNNLGLALVLGGWYWLAGLVGFEPDSTLMGVAPGIALNVLALLASVALCCLLARRVFKTNAAVALVFLLCAAFAPFWLYSPCFYSDTLSMPFGLLALLAFDAWRREARPRRRLLFAAGAGAAAFVGYAVKGSVAVMAVALAIQFFLQAKPRRALAACGAMLAAFGLLAGGYRLWQRAWLIDWAEEDALTLPIQLWFCYGSHDDGNYSQADYEAAMTVDTVAERKELLNARIAANYASYTLPELAEFVTRKAAITWGDGLTLLCAVFYAAHIVAVAKVSPGKDIYLLTVFQFAFAALYAWIGGALTETFPAQALADPQVIGPLCYLGVMATTVALLFQNVGLVYSDPSSGAVILSLESVFGVLCSVVFYGDPVTVKLMAGFLLIFLAVVCSETKFAFLKQKLNKNG